MLSTQPAKIHRPLTAIIENLNTGTFQNPLTTCIKTPIIRVVAIEITAIAGAKLAAKVVKDASVLKSDVVLTPDGLESIPVSIIR